MLEHKLEELKQGKKVEEPEDIKVALETMDASKRLSEKDIEAVTDNLSDYHREIDSNVVIAREFISPLLGSKGIIDLNSRHASSSELHGFCSWHLERTWHWLAVYNTVMPCLVLSMLPRYWS